MGFLSLGAVAPLSILSGTTSQLNHQQEEEQRALWETQLQHALIDVVQRDPQLGQEYREARAAVPDLVQTESPAWMFVLRENGNLPAAATRLCRWWKTRKRIFGKDRWLLPLNQTGRGALANEDVRILRTGTFLCLLTPGGRALCVVDFGRLPAGATRKQPRCYFYLTWAAAQEHPATCENGVTIVFLVSSKQTSSQPIFDRALALSKLQAFPVAFRQSLVVQVYDSEPGKEHLLDFLGYQQMRTLQTKWQQTNVQWVTGQSVAETRSRLVQAATLDDTSCLPIALGGRTQVDLQMQEWVRARLSVEDVMGSPPTSLKSGQQQDLTVNVSTPRVWAAAAAAVPSQRRNKKPPRAVVLKRNAFYSRRAYYKKQASNELLKKEVAALRAEQAKLHIEHELLSRMLEEAQQLVKQETGDKWIFDE